MADTTDTDNEAAESDAQVLWADVVDLIAEEGGQPALLAMLRSCKAADMDDASITIAAGSGFVKRTIEKNAATIESCLERAAFQPIRLFVELDRAGRAQGEPAAPAPVATTISPAELARMREAEASQASYGATGNVPAASASTATTPAKPQRDRTANPLVEGITAADSRLTFDTYVEGEENQLALQAAKAVANGSHGYNPLFIYGKSGLGKTHLLKAIQNYLAVNVPDRICVYRQARDFVGDYTSAMLDTSRGVKEALEQNYHDIDVLIIDDIQGFRGAAKSVDFFFDTFNYLTSHGKQIVLAADESPAELGLAERVSSRLDSGVTLSIQVPNYELKYGLIKAFYQRMKADAAEDGLAGFEGEISEDNLEYMASRAGTNIRTIKAFCQSCLLAATTKQHRGEQFTREDIAQIAVAKWGLEQRTFTIEQIQKFVEQRYDISHADLVSNKRNKALMEPRHVAVWLARELTDSTLAQIGERFGGRSHATVKHSIKWVEERRDADRVVHDKISQMKEDLMSS